MVIAKLGGADFRIVHLMVNDPFKALAHPLRRDIVARLARGGASVGEATSSLGVSKSAISKHLKVLEEAGVILRVIDGRTHWLELDVAPLDEAGNWIDCQRTVWERMLDGVEDYVREREGG
jgi:DNA-binding transcriptional ArsR family regulator